MLPKIKSKHIYPTSFEKMKVHLATQPLSSLSSSIQTMISDPSVVELNNEVSDTIVLKIMNDLFDLLNNRDSNETKYLKDGGLKCILTYYASIRSEDICKKLNSHMQLEMVTSSHH